jgi:1-acyl-sn-glycerol-3-phosphate acyltransferase
MAEAPAERRRPRARVRPQELAAARGGAREGLAWLGRVPESRASLLVRVVSAVARLVILGIFGLRLRVEGREHIPRQPGGRPAGSYLLVAASHRGWLDPFVALHAVPLEPRVWFLGSGPSTFTSRWRERLMHRLGGMLPVWRGGVGIDGHVAAVRAVLDNGGVVAQMPEGNINGPPGRISAFRPGAMLMALRTGAPILPLAIAGTEELYRGRRVAARLLPMTSIAELLGPAWDGRLPEPGTRAELELAKGATDALERLLGPVVEELHPGTVDPPDHPRPWARRLTWLLLGPGPVERE